MRKNFQARPLHLASFWKINRRDTHWYCNTPRLQAVLGGTF
jgi:hypothetical protein